MNDNYVTLGQICEKGSSNVAQKDLAVREGQYPIYGAAGLIKNVDFAHQRQPYIAIVKDGAGIGRVMKLPAYSSVIGTMQYIIPKENVSIDYLFYALQYMNLGKYFSGSTIPHIYFRDYQKERLKLPTLEVQQSQAEMLGRIDTLSSYAQKQIALLDDLVKSRFVEMFGDPIINSKSLTTKDLKDVLILKAGDFTAASEIFDEPSESNPYPCFGGNGIRGYVAEYNQEGEYSLVGRQGALSGNVQYASGRFKNTEHALLVTPTVEMNSIWLYQLLLNLDLKRYQTGAAQPGLSVKNLQEIQIICVPIKEQNRFAAFVEQTDKSKFSIRNSLQHHGKLWTASGFGGIINLDYSMQRRH